MSLLLSFVATAEPAVWRSVAQAVCVGLLRDVGAGAVRKVAQAALLETVRQHGTGQHVAETAGDPAANVAFTATAAGTPLMLRLVRMPRIDPVLVLDDRPEVVGGPEHLACWRDWLAASNLLQFLDDGERRFAALTVRQQPLDEDLPGASGAQQLSPQWREVIDVADQSCRSVLVELATLGAPLPEPGRDGPGNEWQIDLAWPEYGIAVLMDDYPDRVQRLQQEDWLVLDANADDILRRIAERARREH
jgi:hypothetical protein